MLVFSFILHLKRLKDGHNREIIISSGLNLALHQQQGEFVVVCLSLRPTE